MRIRNARNSSRTVTSGIKTLKARISYLKSRDYLTFGKDLAELRDDVLYAHSTLERTLEIIIIDRLLKQANPEGDFNTKAKRKAALDFIVTVSSINQKLSFFEKLNTAKVSGAISSHLVSHILELNRARNVFVHPVSLEYKKYLEKKEVLSVLRHAVASLHGMIYFVKTPTFDKLAKIV